MVPVSLPANNASTNQTMTISVSPNGIPRKLRVQIVYREYVGKYFASVWNAETDEALLLNFPVVASESDAQNDLLKTVAYKTIGSLICMPVTAYPTHEYPNGTISEYELVWGDCQWI